MGIKVASAKTFVVIHNPFGPVAFLVEQYLNGEEMQALLRLRRVGFVYDAELTKRWKVDSVICDPDWAREQKKRVPMTKPKGVRFAFVEDK